MIRKGSVFLVIVLALVIGCATPSLVPQKMTSQDNNNSTTTGTDAMVEMIHGFRLIEEKKIEEINCYGKYFIHEKSGARLLKLENDDDNKVFCISFKTLPYSDNGIMHVLEHSVMNGSRKYPVKSPFEILVKGSLNTFLNAMTAADRTMYPMASKNEKDFNNLMDVYMDAVLYPQLYNEPKILMQEGWHYDLEAPEAELKYNGIVYNEMKGALSSPESMIWTEVPRVLLPDTIYTHVSGGMPKAIPDLTQEEFVNFHKQYYHPSNSYILLYGDGDTGKELQFLDEKYLSAFDKIDIKPEISLQESFTEMKESVCEFSISEGDTEEDKSIIALTFVTGLATDTTTNMAIDVMRQILSSSAAPLRDAIMEANIGKDMYVSYMDSIKQPILSIVLKNTNPGAKEKFKEIVFTTLQKMVDEGIDKKLIEATINSMEFRLREADFGGFPKGLVYGMMAVSGWMYADDPFLSLGFEKELTEVKQALKSTLIEDLIQKYILSNNHAACVTFQPKKGLESERTEMVREKLASYKASLSEEQIMGLVEQTKLLREYQLTPDSEEGINTIPLLSLKDIDPKAKQYNVQVGTLQNAPVIFYPAPTNKIIYSKLFFNADSVPQELIQYAGLLVDVIGDFNTQSYTYGQLDTQINMHTGGVNVNLEGLIKDYDDRVVYPYFVVSAKAFDYKLDKLIDLEKEMLLSSKYDDPERLHDVLQKIRSRLQSSLGYRGLDIASTRLRSHFSPLGAFLEQIEGLSYYRFVKDIEENFDQKKQEIIDNLNTVVQLVFTKENVQFGLICSDDERSAAEKELNEFLNNLPSRDRNPVTYSFKMEKKNEGLFAPTRVNYVTQGYNIKYLGYDYSGKLRVLKQILSNEYLHNRIRVMGGAYGAFASFTQSGFVYFGSYRDPHVSETLDNFKATIDDIRNDEINERDMTRFIIGTMSRLDYPMSPSVEGSRAILNYIQGVDNADIQQERDEVLNTTALDIKAMAGMLEKVIAQDYFCVFGDEEILRSQEKLFDELVPIFE